MIYVISKTTFGSYDVRDIQCNANWDCCPYSDYALIPESMVDEILATQGYCDITLNSAGTEVVSFEARTIPEVPDECCGVNTVLSVNGKTANRDGEVMLTPSDVGAAPAGYGLGGTPKDIAAAELDTTTSNGWYRLANQSITVGGYTYPDWYVHVVKYSNSYLVQEMYTLNGYKAVRICNNGTWYDEWESPPMELGVEYRTTKRYNRKVVYVKALDLGKLPSSGDKSVMYSNTAASIVSIDAYNITSSGNVYIFPAFNASGTLNGTVTASAYNVYVTAYTDLSARTGFAIVRYTKD